MSVCANRSDTHGFFTPCSRDGQGCRCGAEVAADLAVAEDTDQDGAS